MNNNRFRKKPNQDPHKGYTDHVELNESTESRFEDSAEAKLFEVNQSQKNFSAVAFLANFRTVQVKDENNVDITALLLVFFSQSGDWIHCYLKHDPYFLIKCSEDRESEVVGFLEKKFDGKFKKVSVVEKVDLQTMNHLSGIKTRFVKCEFHKENDMLFVKSLVLKQMGLRKARAFVRRGDESGGWENPLELIESVREHDITYSARVCIDHRIRVSFWYAIEVEKGFLSAVRPQPDLLEKPEFPILAFDIETTKLPLKFPDARIDSILLISYVIDRHAFLIVNREIVSEDVHEFTYSPKPEFAQSVHVFNEPSEKAAIQRFLAHIRLSKPFIVATFNGDMFDIPFVLKRAEVLGVSVEQEVGLVAGRSENTFIGKFMICHLDCYYWVKRDAFLPQGSHGLKAVTKSKLGYVPIECDPEEILTMAKTNPQKLAEYSVSDAVATYFLYTKHIHDFIFALCTIVPMVPDDVLRRGSGTLCEHLLMAKAFENDIVFPNKSTEEGHKYFNGYLIESDTYVGGFVECLNNGAYRADIPIELKLDARAYEDLVDVVDKVIDFYLAVEHPEGLTRDAISNVKEVEEQIKGQLLEIRDQIVASPSRPILRHPLIYHVDVASMYPNIILTNRLQPTAIVDDQVCSNCLFNESRNQCKRPLLWDWKVTHYPIKKLEFEKFLVNADKANLKGALKVYCQKNYKTVHKTVVQEKENTVCMRENSFYVDTIRDFRDRRYDYKAKAKHFSNEESDWAKKGHFEKASEAATLSVLFDSLQLAHKIILNSFYGYVMKKGARWYSMEMAAMVTHTGKNIIQEARNLFDRVGKPLELDTDGIWTVLPKGFPERFQLRAGDKRPLSFSFICSLINYLIYDKFKNTQYQDLAKATNAYTTRSEMQIFFELDGPYKAMIIPASKEEHKNLKKRYVVFNFDNKISEIKGFEIKRRGELGMVKAFQAEIFGRFLEGSSLKGLYGACAETASKWLAILQTKAVRLSDTEVIELLGETKVLSKAVEEYGVQKGIALTAAKRLAHCLGEGILKGTGLNCHFVISKSPENAPLNERAVPIPVFSFEEGLRKKYLKTWLRVSDDSDFSLKAILDWDYYIDRLNSNIQKIIVIPAILQGLENPIPELECPDWLRKRVNQRSGVQNTLAFATKTAHSMTTKLAEQPLKGHQSSSVGQPVKAKPSDDPIDLEDTTIDAKLLSRKQFWLSKRSESLRQTFPVANSLRTDNVGVMMQSNSVMHKRAVWHLVKVEATSPEGLLKLYIVLNGEAQAVRLVSIPRVFYVHSFVEESFDRVKLQLSKKQLPHEKQNWFLYEFEVEEALFRKCFWKFTDFVTDASKEGVYETNVPLDFRAVLQLGSLCKPEGKPLTGTAQSIGELRADFDGQPPLFFRSSVFGKERFLVFLWSVSYRQSLFTFVFSRDSLRVLKLSKERKNEAVLTNLWVLVRDKLTTLFGRKPYSDFESEFRFTKDDIFVFKERSLYAERLKRIKVEVESEVKMRPILIASSSKSLSASVEVANTWNDMPVIELKSAGVERSRIDDLTPEKTFVATFFDDLSSLEERLMRLDKLSQYTRVPLCNLSGSYSKSLAKCVDVAFARELLRQNAVLWYSDERLPDLGVNGFNCYDLEDFLLSQDTQSVFVKPQLCLSYVVEVNVVKFFNGALLSMDQYVNLDRDFGDSKWRRAGNAWNVSNTYSTYNKVGLKAIRSLFKQWLDDLKKHDSQCAQDLLQKLVPWACTEHSKFYDPVIERTLLFVANSLFNALLSKFHKMGMRVVFANPYKVFLDTRKFSLESATSAVNFVLEAVVAEQGFSEVYFCVERFYKSLLFYDLDNYHGCAHVFDEESADRPSPDSRGRLEMVSQWHMQSFLPAHLQGNFGEYVDFYMRKWMGLAEQEGLGDSGNPLGDKDKVSRVERSMEEFLLHDFSSSLFEFLGEVQERQREAEADKFDQSKRKDHSHFGNSVAKRGTHTNTKHINVDGSESEEDVEELVDDSFIEDDGEDIVSVGANRELTQTRPAVVVTPVKKRRRAEEENEPWRDFELEALIGGVKRTDNLAFEFMNLLLEVFGVIGEGLQECISGMKANCLRYLNISREPESCAFQRVYLGCSLPNVVCGSSSCDILKPVRIFEDFSTAHKGWFCYCGRKYSVHLIEDKVIDYVNNCYKLMVASNPRCLKCHRVCTDHFSKVCSCHGELSTDRHAIVKEFEQEFNGGLTNFKALALSAEMKGLEDFLRSIDCN
jgi:DNA polymerase epsilon subunit 1